MGAGAPTPEFKFRFYAALVELPRPEEWLTLGRIILYYLWLGVGAQNAAEWTSLFL